jgi:hypothetical protein
VKPRLVTPLGPLSEYDEAEREAREVALARKSEGERKRREASRDDMNRRRRELYAQRKSA